MNLKSSRLARLAASVFLAGTAISAAAASAAVTNADRQSPHDTYSDDEVAKAASDFFSTGAIGVGLRYGRGELVFKGVPAHKVYWQGPSIGFDVGGNAVKTFILVYGLPDAAALYKRYPGVEGSVYFVGGFGVNYVQRDGIALAPVRFGVGWRLGIALSYMNFSQEKRYIPL